MRPVKSIIPPAVEYASRGTHPSLASGRNGRKSDIFCFDRCRHKCSPTRSTGRTSRVASPRRSKHMSELVHTQRASDRDPSCIDLQPAQRIARRGRPDVEHRRPTPTSKGLYPAIWGLKTPDMDIPLQDCSLQWSANRRVDLIGRRRGATGNAVSGGVGA